MAKYTVDWSCGHHTVEQLFGHHKDRERKIDWMQSQGICPDCFRAKKQAEREAVNQQAAALNHSQQLPSLTGSDKQISWAESIRRAALDAAHNQIHGDAEAKLASVPEAQRPRYAAVLDAMRAARAKLESEASAKWWIDHRSDVYPLESFVRDAGIAADKAFQQEAANAAA